ncbi:hypothetical protein QE152_g34246 [Popillia japonica]|uniref:Uncharacterized protein n=1 Tax=Popillia japonica TaxID=7064 RepID=A0AAW1ITP1_POPJA
MIFVIHYSGSRMDESDSDSNSIDSAEEARLRDIKERDEFAERLKKRDGSKIIHVSDKSVYEKAAKKLKLENEDREKMVPALRVQSRRKYLEKRKDDKLQELEADIQDDEYLFNDDILTTRERKQRQSKKELLKLAQEHEKARELEKVQRYHMPRDLGKGETADYIEVDELEKLPQSEQKKWEKEQMTSAVFSFGAKNKIPTSENQYDLLIEDQIEFIQALQIPGTKPTDSNEPKLTELQMSRMNLEETKRSLPVFRFRNDIIEAVKKYQVLIIEGETGSGKTTQIPQYLYEAGFADGGTYV